MSEYLPEEIVMKILARLPPKPLMKFRCVSKSWYCMISSPHFISLHTQHALSSSSNTNQMLVRRYTKPHDREIFTLNYEDVNLSHEESIKNEYPFRFDVRFCSRMWHTVEDRIRRNYYVAEYIWSQAFINGNVHWTAFKITGTNNKLENMIMSFDVILEVFDEMRLPEALENEHPMNLSVVDFGGSLAVVRYDNHRVDSKSCSIWVMKKYGDVESWSRDYNIYAGFEGGIRIGTILGLRGNGDVLMSSSNGGLVSHSRLTGANVDFVLLGTNHSFYVGPYFESLVLLSGQSESDQELAGLIEFEDCVEHRFAEIRKKEIMMLESVMISVCQIL